MPALVLPSVRETAPGKCGHASRSLMPRPFALRPAASTELFRRWAPRRLLIGVLLWISHTWLPAQALGQNRADPIGLRAALTDGITDDRLTIGVWFATEHQAASPATSVEMNRFGERVAVRGWLVVCTVRVSTHAGLHISSHFPSITGIALRDDQLQGETFRIAGWGDTSIIGWYRFPSTSSWHVTMNVGASLPTGRPTAPHFNPRFPVQSLVPLSTLQAGSGTVDPVLGGSLNWQQQDSSRTKVFFAAAARLPMSANQYLLAAGGVWEGNAGISRQTKWPWLVATGRLRVFYRERDLFPEEPVSVGGGKWLSFAPGAAIEKGGFSLQAELAIVVYRQLANRQLESTWQAKVGAVRVF